MASQLRKMQLLNVAGQMDRPINILSIELHRNLNNKIQSLSVLPLWKYSLWASHFIWVTASSLSTGYVLC